MHYSTPIELGVEPLQCPSRPFCGEGGPLGRLTPTPHTLPMTRAMPLTLAGWTRRPKSNDRRTRDSKMYANYNCASGNRATKTLFNMTGLYQLQMGGGVGILNHQPLEAQATRTFEGENTMLGVRKRGDYWQVFNSDTGHERASFEKKKDAIAYCVARNWNAYY